MPCFSQSLGPADTLAIISLVKNAPLVQQAVLFAVTLFFLGLSIIREIVRLVITFDLFCIWRVMWTRRVPPVPRFLFKESAWTYRKSNGTTVARQWGSGGVQQEGGGYKGVFTRFSEWATEGVTMVIWHPNVAVGDLGYREREPVTSAGAREQANSSMQERCDVVYAVLCLAVKSHRYTQMASKTIQRRRSVRNCIYLDLVWIIFDLVKKSRKQTSVYHQHGRSPSSCFSSWIRFWDV